MNFGAPSGAVFFQAGLPIPPLTGLGTARSMAGFYKDATPTELGSTVAGARFYKYGSPEFAQGQSRVVAPSVSSLLCPISTRGLSLKLMPGKVLNSVESRGCLGGGRVDNFYIRAGANDVASRKGNPTRIA